MRSWGNWRRRGGSVQVSGRGCCWYIGRCVSVELSSGEVTDEGAGDMARVRSGSC